MGKRDIASEEIDHFQLASVSGIDRFQRGSERINSHMDGDFFQLFACRNGS
jgi:hypothetical protein